MQTIHLMEYHLGGAPQGGAASEGATPSPQLPDAGKPYVESVSYDKDTKKLRLRAQNARAGEVKTPLGDWQEFPIEVPTPPVPPAPTLPDAGKPRVSKFEYDPTTRKVKVQASVQQAGEVKTPLGEEQTFDIPAEPAKPAAGFKGYFYKYVVENKTTSDTPGAISTEDQSTVLIPKTGAVTLYSKKFPFEMGKATKRKFTLDLLPDYAPRVITEDTFSLEDGYLCITQKIDIVNFSDPVFP